MDVVTHNTGTRAGQTCRCSRCGVERQCTPDFDFYGELGAPLICQTCMVQEATGRPDGKLFELSPGRVICARHGEPFRAGWPTGYPAFALTLLQPLLATAANLDELGRHLDQQAACCRAPRSALLAAYLDCGVGVLARCQHCRKREPGTPYSVSAPGGGVQHIAHLCFHCVVFQLVARAN